MIKDIDFSSAQLGTPRHHQKDLKRDAYTTRIGDFPDWEDYPGIGGRQRDMRPWMIRDGTAQGILADYIYTTSTISSSTPWKTSYDSENITLSLDLPGVKPDDLDVEIKERTVAVSARRFDTKEKNTYEISVPVGYDLETLVATYDTSVLSIVVAKVKPSPSFKVTVIKK